MKKEVRFKYKYTLTHNPIYLNVQGFSQWNHIEDSSEYKINLPIPCPHKLLRLGPFH